LVKLPAIIIEYYDHEPFILTRNSVNARHIEIHVLFVSFMQAQLLPSNHLGRI
jgi:hypothetical protein